ncbi:MAG: RNA polymerase sigma factor [Acidimicrobiales bacterium]
MGDASDEALIAGLAAGDSDAALVFVRRWQRRVFGVTFAVLGDRGRAEDAAQEAFVRAWRHAAAYDPRRASVATWLLTMARTAAIDVVRVERARPFDPTLVVEVGVDDSIGPEALAGRNDDLARVALALGSLPEEQRRALLLATLHGRTANEVGAIEGIPLGTAKTRIRTGLNRVRLALDVEVAP